jgi:hypothetical protein
MPELSGRGVLEGMRTRRVDVPVIAWTPRVGVMEGVAAADRAPGARRLTVPWTVRSLLGNEHGDMQPRTARRCTAMLVFFLGALGDSPASADPARPVHFSYEAPSGCPTEAQFVEAIRKDGGPFARAPAGASARELRIRIALGDHVTGELVVRDPTGVEAVRTIDGARCEDVARALAVVASLSLEASAAAPEPPAQPPATVAAATPPVRVDVAPPAERPSTLEPLPPGWRLGVSAAGTMNGSIGLGLGLAAYVEVVHDVRDGFAPALRLGVEFANGGTGVPTTGPFAPMQDAVSLSQRVGRLDACPLRAVAARPWSPSPIEAWACARLDAGVLDAIDTHLPNGTDMQRPWMAAGSLVHVRWVMRRFFVDLEGGVMFPLLRERFYVEPSTSIYQVPAVTGAGGLALGVYFL